VCGLCVCVDGLHYLLMGYSISSSSTGITISEFFF